MGARSSASKAACWNDSAGRAFVHLRSTDEDHRWIWASICRPCGELQGVLRERHASFGSVFALISVRWS